MKAVWVLGLASLALLMGLAVYLVPLQPTIVALQFSFRSSAFQAVLDAWGPQGVARYRSHLPVDGVLLLCYGAFGVLLARRTAWFGGFSATAQHRVATLTPLAAVCDAAENLLHGYLTGEGVSAAPVLYGAAGAAASLKWLFLLLFALVCAVAAWQRCRE